jgi:hypothetical protein
VPWFRLDDSFHSHPKVIAAGNEAVGLYVRCGTYAAQHLTDGFIPDEVALLYGSRELAGVLVRTKLWRRARGGWQMPDYLKYNPSRVAVDNDREKAAERQRRHRSVIGARSSLHLENHDQDPGDNSGSGAGTASNPRSQEDLSRRDSHRDSRVSHTTPTRPDPLTNGSVVTRGAGQARARDPNSRYRPDDNAASRHPSARTAADAARDAGIRPGQRPADDQTRAAIAARARQAINRESP